MSAAKYDLTISRGADFDFTLRILDANEDPVSLTGSSDCKAEIREDHKRPLIASFTTETNTGVGSSNQNLNLADGEVKFILTDNQTATLDAVKKYKWDFFWTDSGGLKHKLLYGSVTIEPNITNI